MDKKIIRFEVEQGEAGLWYGTSPDVKGLLVAEQTFAACLRMIPEAIENLERAAVLGC
jgi:predicted RNase H-like HicB family nuclease